MLIPRWYQQEAVDAIYHYFRSNSPVNDDGTVRELNPLIALPTGTGKAFVIALFCTVTIKSYPTCRILMLTDSKELIQQNADELLGYWPFAPMGVVSAGLGKADYGHPITFAGIASVVKKPEKLGRIDIVIVDEAHMISPKGEAMYQKLFKHLRTLNPQMRIIGLTATAYRMGIGELTNNGIFTDVIYDLTKLDQFNRLVNEGFISPLVTRKTATKLDLSKVGIVAGEYNLQQLEAAVDQNDITLSAVQELMYYGQDRHSWLIFAAGVNHAEHVADCLRYYGVPAAAVHGAMSDKDRDDAIRAYKNFELRALTNNNILTKGFNHRPVDLIGMLRPTKSTSLWVQMLGRGTRPSPETGKVNCICLDYAGNTASLGPINDPCLPSKKKKGSGDAPVWCCPKCGYYNHARAPYCIACGEPHDTVSKIEAASSTLEVMRSDNKIVQTFEVQRCFYYPQEPKREGQMRSMRVDYACGLRVFREWVNFENPRAAYYTSKWWHERTAMDVPATVEEALKYVDYLKEPRRINVWINSQHPRIEGYEF